MFIILLTGIRKTAYCRTLYEKHLVGDKSEFAVTLDVTLIYEYETNAHTQIF